MIRYALLALLRDQPDYGYRLKRRFDDRVGRAWLLNVGQVYQTLQALTRTGLIRELPGRRERAAPGRRVFEITPKGVRALERWVRRAAARLRPVRDELLLRLLCVAPDGYPMLIAEVTARQQACRLRLEELRLLRARALRGGTGTPLAALALSAEVLHTTAQLEWLAHVCTVLRAAAPAPRGPRIPPTTPPTACSAS